MDRSAWRRLRLILGAARAPYWRWANAASPGFLLIEALVARHDRERVAEILARAAREQAQASEQVNSRSRVMEQPPPRRVLV